MRGVLFGGVRGLVMVMAGVVCWEEEVVRSKGGLAEWVKGGGEGWASG